jgi:N-acyl-D-aspartate/D-glutamate deacylase
MLIRGGEVIDGTGAPAARADVRVRSGVIVDVAPNLRPDGDEEVIDAGGAFVTPGFIDNHTHFDPSLYWDPFADPMPQHGVTSVLIGNCSLSLAPLRPDHRQGMSEVFSYIEDIPEPAFRQEIPWGWETYAEYRDILGLGGLGLNVACLIGHTPLRLYVMGEDAWDRAASPAERAAMAAVLDDSLRAGAFGLSTSFFDEDADNRPVPSRLADDDEFAALFDVLAAHGGMLEFIPDPFSPTAKEMINRMAALTGPRGIVSTWNAVSYQEEKPERGLHILDRAAELQEAGVRMYPQISPRSLDFKINWDSSMAFMQLAGSWHRFVNARGADKLRMLEDPHWRATGRAEWDACRAGMIPTRHIEKIRLISVHSPELHPWLGCSLADLVAERGGHPSDVLADWMLENDLAAGIVSQGIANGDPAGVGPLFRHRAGIVGASDAGAHLQMMCAAGDSTLLLTTHVRDRGDISLEHAVWQLTGRQAELFGFGGRGVIAAGNTADVTVFALDELHWLPDVFVDDVPTGGGRLRRPEGGYRYTMAGGVITQEMGKLTGARPAGVLKRVNQPAAPRRRSPSS